MKKSKKRNFFKRFWDAFWRPEMLILPGEVAFFLFLSILPTITLISYTTTYLKVSNELIYTLISNALGGSISELLTPIITSTKITPAFFITLGIGYFMASQGMSSIIVASNTIYGIKDSGFFKRRLKAIIMEVIIVVLLLFVLIFPLLGDSIISIIYKFELDTASTSILIKTLSLLKGPISWLIIFLVIKMIYTMAPDKKIPSNTVNGGAIFATICWILITYGYSYYIEHYANYSVFYGSLANIVVLMIWVYLLSYVFVVGMAMNQHEELEKTGIIEITNLIEESANSASVMPEEEQPKKTTKKTKKDKTKEVPEEKQDNQKTKTG